MASSGVECQNRTSSLSTPVRHQEQDPPVPPSGVPVVLGQDCGEQAGIGANRLSRLAVRQAIRLNS